VTNKFRFQGQEHQEETGWDSFKWRNHQPDIGRFFNVDPLSEDYVYNSPYAFSENRVIDGIELEGLEWVSIKGNNNIIVNIVNVKVKNTSSKSDYEVMGLAMDKATQAETSLSGKDTDGNTVITRISLDFDSNDNKGDFYLELRDNIELDDKTTTIHFNGRVDEIGNTQKNRIQVNVRHINKDREDLIRSGAHEFGHTGGATHPVENPTMPGKDADDHYLPFDNLMIQSGSGKTMTPDQLKEINNEVDEDIR
jgi:RHS repeat-associated protein